MKKYLFLFLILVSVSAFSQITNVKGEVIDANTGETLIGASVVYGNGQGVAADLDGNYFFSIPNGNREISVSYVGYKQLIKTIILATIKVSAKIF